MHSPIAIATPMGIKDLGNPIFSQLIRIGLMITTGFEPVVINAFSHLGDEQ
jgi:formate/nitrite transporter FocA (FNT family)